jgi:putative FmdB family regulatory protein
MPLFEFVCTTCEQDFEELVRNASATDDVVCPSCGGSEVKKKISKFASRISGSTGISFGASSAASCSTGST